ncbi:MAG: endonuclease domain-containing protein [Pseudoflavonifractor sp.]
MAAEPTERALRIRTAPELLDHAKRLRQEMTRQERRLWYDFLRTHPMKWYKQRPYCGYVLDFFCQQIMLAVELDGGQHYEEAGKSYDEERAENLKKNGVTVLRFSNLDIEKNFSGVCQSINIEINCHQNKQPMEKL